MNKKLLGAKSKARKSRRILSGQTVIKKALISKRYAKDVNKTIARDNKRSRKSVKQTKPEQKISLILIKHHIKFEREYKILGMFFDFYIHGNEGIADCLLEVDGEYWHCKDVDDHDLQLWQLSRKINDIYKNSIAVAKEVRLIRVWAEDIEENKIIELIQNNGNNKISMQNM